MTTLIVGRTGTGKDALRTILEKKFGWKFVQSYTTRPCRSEEDKQSHVFITKEQADGFKDRVAWTEINGYEYFSTREQLDEADGYIIDPSGAEELLRNAPDIYFQIVYLTPKSKERQRELSIGRADDPENEARVFESRVASEDAQFSAFEAALANNEPAFPDASNYEIMPFVNTYEEKDIVRLAEDMEAHRKFRENAGAVIRHLMAAGDMRHTEGMVPLMALGDGTDKPVPIDVLCSYFREDQAMLGQMMYRWMARPDVDCGGMEASRG